MQEILKKIRINCLELSYKCEDGNLQSAFSCIDILWVLYDKIIENNINKDSLIISKGQAVLALYSVLLERGVFNKGELSSIGSFDSRFSNQSDRTKFSGEIENSAGSLGHGLPIAVGIAMANKIKKDDSNVYVLVGDGEFMEGTMWESCLIAKEKKLDNLYVIVDDNDSAKEMINLNNLERKLKTFGFKVVKINGHNVNSIVRGFKKCNKSNKPKAIIAKTKRGYGSYIMMNNNIWFHKYPNKEELDILTKEINQ